MHELRDDEKLTESEAMGLRRRALVLAVHSGLISTLTAIVALPPMADPPTHHGRKDDLDSIHVCCKVCS